MNYRERCYGSFVSRHWKFYYSLSEADFNFMRPVYARRYAPFLPSDRACRIIDVACGSGHLLYFLNKEGYTNSQGIDLSKEQLEVAGRLGLRNVEHADLFRYLPGRREEYDVVFANDIIEHLTKDEVVEFLDLVYASLKPGGTAVIGTVNASSLFGSRVFHIDFTHETCFTAESLSQVMRVCGFDPAEVYGEKPLVRDLRSAVRAGLWWGVKKLLNVYRLIQDGTGRGLYGREVILEPRMFAVGRKAR